MRWMGIVACIAFSACKFDTSTSSAVPGQIDAAITGDSISFDGSEGQIDASVDAAMSMVDAGFQAACALSCPGAGGTCNDDGTCEIYCNEFTGCNTVNCPNDVPCDVTCMKVSPTIEGNACNSVVCANAMPCVVTCSNGTGLDDKGCNNVSCNNNCSCQVNCIGEDACNSVSCSGQNEECESGNGCNGSGQTCDTCP